MKARKLVRWAGAGALAISVAAGWGGARFATADGPQPNAAWPQFKLDGTRNPIASRNGPFTPVQQWNFSTGSPIVGGPVIDDGGALWVTTENNKVFGVNKDGTKRCEYQIDGGGQPTYPAINRVGRIVVAAQGGFVVGLKSDCQFDWMFDLANAPYSDGRTPMRSAPLLSSVYPNLLVGADNNNVYELDEGGSFKGVRRANGSIRAGTMVTADATLVWASISEKAVYGGLSTGGDKWKLGVDGDVNSTPVSGPDNTIYVITDAGSLYAIPSSGPPNGNPKWKVKVGAGGTTNKFSPSVAKDGTIYVGTPEGRLYAVSPTDGSTRWSFGTGGALNSSAAIGANGMIYLGSNDNTLYVLNPNGTQFASVKTEGAIDLSAPAIGADGTLYVGDRNGKLYAFKEGGPTPTAGPPPAGTVSGQPSATAAPAQPTAVPPTPTPAPLITDRAAPIDGAVYYNETGHNLRGAFLNYFNANGGLDRFGFPRSEEIQEGGKTVQYFQRARMEYRPDLAGTPGEVELGLIGDDLLRARSQLR